MNKHFAGSNIPLRSPVLIVLLTVGWAAASMDVHAQKVYHHPDSDDALDERWDWAMKEGARQSDSEGYWIGYSIQRLMNEYSFIGNRYDSERNDRRSLNELVHGIRAENPESVRRSARRVLNNLEKLEKQVVKDVAILFRLRKRDGEPREVVMGNMSIYVDLKDRPLFWLGEIDDASSLALLEARYDHSTSMEAKKGIVWSVGIHQDADRVIPMLESVLSGNESGEIRKSASYSLGNQNDGRALRILRRTVKDDSSSEVRKSAVYAMSNMELEDATAALIGMVSGGGEYDVEVRKAAAYALGNIGTPEARKALIEILSR